MSGPSSRVQGVIVRLHPVGDADLIVSLLSPESGLVDAYARAARKSSRRFGGRLELFVEGIATVTPGRGSLPQLSAFEASAALIDGALDYPRLALASHAAELALAGSQPEHADPALVRWLRSTLVAIAAAPEVEVGPARFGIELGWLVTLGVAPPLGSCAACGGSLADGASWTRPHDGLRCRGCSPFAAVQIDGLDLAALAGVASTAEAALAPLRSQLAPPTVRLVRSRIAGLLDEQLGRRTRSAAALDALVGA